MFPQRLATPQKNLYPVAQNNKSEVGFVMLTGFPREAVESFSGYARSYIGGLVKVPIGFRHIISIVFALCDNLLLFSSP